MPKIIHRRDPAGITLPNVYNVDDHTNILDWLNYTFENQEELTSGLACSFVLNGKEIFRSDHEEVDHSILDITISGNDSLTIANRPAAVGAIVYAVIAIISIAISVYTYMNQPKLPGAEEGRNESPNNRLNAASNEFRPGQGIPELFGFGVSYPDFIQPSYYYYDNNVKKVVGVFCVGVGSMDITEVRVGDTDINSIPESSASVYGPGSTPPSEFLAIHQQASNIDGQELVPPNDNSVVYSGISFSAETEPAAFDGRIITITTSESVMRDLQLADDNSYLYIRSGRVNGVFRIISIDYSTGRVRCYDPEDIFFVGGSTSGSLGRGYVDGVIGHGTLGELDYWIGWFDTPGEMANEVMVHWQAPSGIRAAGGGAITIQIEIQIENVLTGDTFTLQPSLSRNTLDPQFVTTVFNQSVFPTMITGQYKVRARRLTGIIDPSSNAAEIIKVEAYVSVTPYSNPNFGDVTTILTQRRATSFSPDQSGQKINVDYRRKLPYYNRVTDTYEPNNLQATNAQADAAAYTLIVAGNETEQSVNLAELYAIQDGLSDQRLGGFTFTFDDADLSKGERIESICNSSRVVGFHDGKQWRFARDEIKPIRSAMFNRRNVKGSNARQAWQPQRADDADSIRILYVDPDSNTEAFEERKFDLNTGSIVSGEVGITPIEIKLAGCRDQLQASNRADLEVRRIAYQRQSVKETTYREALEIDLLDRVSWVDVNDLDTFDGEIKGFSGDVYDTSEGFYPEVGKDYVVFITDSDGYSSNTVPCTPRSDTEFGFVAAGLSGGYIASGVQQISSRYFIADADDVVASNFTMKARTPNEDGTVEIELTEYREEMYEMD